MKKIILFLLLTIFNLSSYLGFIHTHTSILQAQLLVDHVFYSWVDFYSWLDSQGKTQDDIKSTQQSDEGVVVRMEDQVVWVIPD